MTGTAEVTAGKTTTIVRKTSRCTFLKAIWRNHAGIDRGADWSCLGENDIVRISDHFERE
ncbi:hypothetical protein [Shinella sp.]|uniref:hypothetical protein n=1 Tax=Shinella sp. TaxID=1870904 RepID=UPI0028972E23|nr:hypothetical protein [Shinella sp.]